MTSRHLFGLALIALAPGLGCDTELTMDTRRAFAEQGLQVRETHLLHYDDGVTVDRRHEGRKALRTRGAEPRRERTEVVSAPTKKIVTKSLDEIVLFSGAQQASSFFAAHGIDDDEPIDGLLVAIPNPPNGDGWLTPPAIVGGFTSRAEAVGAIALGGSGTLSGGGGGSGGGGIPTGGGVIIGGGGGSVTRYVMNDDLPLHAAPNFGSATLMEMQRGDRVFVYGTAPVSAAGNVFVEVQAVDRSPYPVGWMPLHWLMVSPAGDVQTTLDFGASYGLMAHVAKDFIKGAFYDHCDSYPRYPQDDIFGAAPQLVNPGSIPYAKRYLCGELPVGEIQSSDWKLLTNYEFTTPEKELKVGNTTVFHVDELDFEVPVMLYRLPWQTRKNYSMMDLSSGYAQGGVDAVEHTLYAKFADALNESAVRVHDTDFWFNVTWNAPAGVTPVAGASGYFNFCWALPGGRLEGGYAPLDITIQGAGTSHITGITWGAVEYSSFRACGTAALRNDPSDIKGDLTTGAQPPIRVQFVRASLKGLSLKFVELPELYGSFAGVHAAIIGFFLDFVSGFAEHEGVMGLLWEAFMRDRLEEQLAGYLFDLGTKLAQRMPDPKDELADACDTLMPAYSSPTSRYYPLYQHCVEAANSASVSYFTNTNSPSTACYAGHYARANDGSAWSSKNDDHHTYYAPPDADPVGLDKPFWVDGCEVEAELQTTVMSGYEDLLECAGAVFDEGVNYRRSMGWIQGQLQSRCLIPTVGFLCDAYGEGDDLVDLWSQELGVEPNVGGVFGFCAWYEDLTTPDTPDYHAP